jgi:predicted metalloprotease with PDZ domain
MKLFYKIDLSQNEQKYVHIELTIKPGDYKENELILMMPVWSPGSYLVREYSRHLDCFETNEPVTFKKISKNQWLLHLNNSKKVIIRYRLYCNEFSVRTNFIDDIHALLVGPATFIVPLQKEIAGYFEVELKLPKGWDKISTGLEPVEKSKNKFYSENLHDFLDCPIEAGKYKTYSFEAFGRPHNLAVIGPEIYNEKSLVDDMKRVVEETGKVIGDIPYKNYTFITHLTTNSTGGIEHKNSSVLHFNRWDLLNPEKYKRMWLSLVSHEYFHLWNIKRIKPSELSDFDYNNENYTTMLWFAEGFTSYFDDIILRRAGIYTDAEYLNVLSYVIERLLNVPGRFYQNLEDSSFDAWIKFYRKHENLNNQGISYYIKGAHLAWALDFEIRKRTGQKKNLDDLMKLLWQDYLKDKNSGYTKERVIAHAESLAGDLKQFFAEFLESTEEIDYDKYLAYAGLRLRITDYSQPTFNFDYKEENGQLVCTFVKDKGSAYQSGIMAGDEIIAMDGYKVNITTFTKRLRFAKTGEKVKLLLCRDERILEKEITLVPSKADSIKIEKIANPTQQQIDFYNKWMGIF